MRRAPKIVLALLLAGALAGSVGCIRRVPIDKAIGSTSFEDSVKLEPGVTDLQTRIAMGAGRLTLAGAAATGTALSGEFDYAPAQMKPQLESSTSNESQEVVLRHPEVVKAPFGQNFRSDWDVLLANGIPTRLTVDMGAGESDIDLSGVEVTDLSVTLGAGKSTIDLTGPYRTHDVDAQIQAGAGELVVRVPKDVPVRVTGQRDGVGDWSAEGFTADKMGTALMNDAWTESQVRMLDAKYRIELSIQRGVGSVRIEME